MVPPSASSFLWQVAPGLEVRPIMSAGRVGLALVWSPVSPPLPDDLAAQIMMRLSELQRLRPDVSPLVMLAKVVCEIHPYAQVRS